MAADDLVSRFDEHRISRLCGELIGGGLGVDLRPMVHERQFVVAYITADSPYADIPRYVEASVFSEVFQLSMEQIVADYGRYDPATTFVCVIDVAASEPVPAGTCRIIEYQAGLGFKDINDLLADSLNNPWLDEIKDLCFAEHEPYNSDVAWHRLCAASGVVLDLDRTIDIASQSSMPNYRGTGGDLTGVSMLFYHGNHRFMLNTGKTNVVAIFDLKPFEVFQQFGDPFESFAGLSPHPYGGPFDTIPTYCVVDKGLAKLYANNEAIGRAFEFGDLLDDIALLPQEYFPNQYSNRALGLTRERPQHAGS